MFNFEDIEKGHKSSTIPEGVLRLYPKHFALSSDVAGAFNSTRKKAENFKIGTIKLGFAYDDGSKAIRISSDENGFSCNFYESGTIAGRLPAALREKAPVGDYKIVEGQRNIFQLVV